MTDSQRFERVLVPVDFSPPSQRAVELARDLVGVAGPGHLILVHAYFVPFEMEWFATDPGEPLLNRISNDASQELEKLLVDLQDHGIPSEFSVVRGYPEQVIVDLARDKAADLIVMGTRGRTGLAHIAFGSIAERVVRTALCPVITVK